MLCNGVECSDLKCLTGFDMKNKFRLMVVAIIIAQSTWYFAPWGLAYPGQSAGALLWIGKGCND